MNPYVPFLFFLTGAAALAHEITWTRLLVLVLGNTTRSVSIILAAFMLGFCIGGIAGGRWADRARRPLRLFGLMELVVGAYALVLPALLRLPIREGGALALLLIPTVAMGTTFPLGARAVIPTASRAGWGAGLLSGCNLLGAAAGAGAAGFVAIRALGIEGTIRAAAFVNLAVGGVAVVAARARVARARVPGTPARLPARSPAPPLGGGDGTVLGAFALAGFSAIGLQVVWSRILAFFLEGFTYTFTSVVCVYLGGMFAGSIVLGAVCRGGRASRGLLALLSGGWAAGAMAGLLLVERFPQGLESLRFALSSSPGSAGFAAGLVLAACLCLWLPTFLLGGMMPVAAALCVRDSGRVGGRLGLLYGLHNLGAALGALGAGFWLLGWAGDKGALLLLSALGVVAALLLLFFGPGKRAGAGRRLLGGAALVALCGTGAVLVHPRRPLILASHIFRGSRGPEHELVVSREGAAGTVSVVDNLRTGERFLYTDDFLAAGTGWRYGYMRMLAHLPALLAEHRDRAMVIGFGSGTTAGALATHPFRSIRIVEISPEVLALADRFSGVNRGVLGDPRVRVEVGDGRHALGAGAGRFDVITLEPLMPYTPGAVGLYTREFYRIGEARLREGGVLCQWLPVHAMRTADFQMLVRTFTEVFPGASLWFYEQSVILVGTRAPLRIPFASFAARAAEEAVAADLRRAGIPSARAALGGFVAAGARLREWLGEGPVMTDDRPEIEFHPLPRSVVTTYAADNLNALRRALVFPGPLLDLGGPGVPEGTEALLRGWTDSTGEVMEGMAEDALSSFLALTGRRAGAADALLEAYRRFERARSICPDNAQARRHLRETRYRILLGQGLSALGRGELGQARAAFAGARDLFPERALPWYHLGMVAIRGKQWERARESLRQAEARFPRHAPTLWQLARTEARLGNRDEARGVAARARALDPVGPLAPRERRHLLATLALE